VTVTPAGSPAGATVTLDGGGQEPGRIEAPTGTTAPPAPNTMVAGVTDGAKSDCRTSSVNSVEAAAPIGSLTRTWIAWTPGLAEDVARTWNSTLWIGGSDGTRMGDGVISTPAGTDPNVTVGEPRYPFSGVTVTEFGAASPPAQRTIERFETAAESAPLGSIGVDSTTSTSMYPNSWYGLA